MPVLMVSSTVMNPQFISTPSSRAPEPLSVWEAALRPQHVLNLPHFFGARAGVLYSGLQAFATFPSSIFTMSLPVTISIPWLLAS